MIPKETRLPSVRLRRAWHITIFLTVAALMMGPAIWNGYPLIYYDTEDYIETAFTFEPIIWRIMTYGVLCTVARVFNTPWAMVVLQALLTAYVLHEAVYGFVGRWRKLVFLVVGTALALFTGLPWVASQVLADVFAGTMVLGVAALAFGEGLSIWRRRALGVVTAVGVCVHMSHVAVAAGLWMVLLVVWGLSKLLRRMPRPRMTVVSAALLGGIALVPATHFAFTGQAYFTRSGQVLQLALFVQTGVAKQYLDEVCPKGASLRMCEHKDNLPYTADEFLWGPSPFDDLGGWVALHDEAGEIVRGAMLTFPNAVALSAFDNTLEQLDLIATGEDLVPMTWHFVKTQLKYFPKEFRQFRFAKQQRRPAIAFDLINAYQIPIAQAAELVTVAVLLFAWRRRDRSSTGLAIIVLVALLGNAIVCGALSNPHDRYQNRVVWLALFTSVVGAVRLDQRFAGVRRAVIKAENDVLVAEELAKKASLPLAGQLPPDPVRQPVGKD